MTDPDFQYDDGYLESILPTFIRQSGWGFTATKHNDTYPLINPSNVDHSPHHVFVTGASKAIGRHIALSYAKAGAAVIGVCARSELSALEQDIKSAAKEAGRPEPQVFAAKLDITDRNGVESAAKSFSDKFGHLDILINNAGYLPKWALHADFDPDEWWRGWEVNVKGTFLVTRAFLPLLLKSSSTMKTVVNLSSAAALINSSGSSGYHLTKLVNLRTAELLYYDYEKDGLLSYSVHPGTVATDLSARVPERIKEFSVDTVELGAHTIVWLTAEKRDWLAGRYVDATWDMSEFEAKRQLIVEKDLLKLRLSVSE